MIDNGVVEQFNQALDLQLGIAVREGAEKTNDEIRDLLSLAEMISTIPANGARPPEGLRERWNQSWKKAGKPRSRPVMRLGWAWGVVLVIIAGLAALFGRPAAIAIGSWLGYGYLPGIGFQRLVDIRVLHSAVIQVHGVRSLAVERGFIDAKSTHLWLAYNDNARAVDGAWLEASNGKRYELEWWGWDPDSPGTRGVHLIFAALPLEANQVTLSLPEGWRIPVKWVPGSEGSLPDAAIVQFPPPTTTPTPAPSPAPDTGSISILPTETMVEAWDSTPCQAIGGIELCAQAAATDGDSLNVLISSRGSGNLLPGMYLGRTVMEQSSRGTIRLDLPDGATYPAEEYIPVQASGEEVNSTLSFIIPRPIGGKARVHIPAVFAHQDLHDVLSFDMGADPNPSQQVKVDTEISVAGMPVRFKEAWIESGANGLDLILLSEPLEEKEGASPYLLELVPPAQFDGGWGIGIENNRLKIMLRWTGSSSMRGGQTGVEIIGATVLIQGPFDLVFDLPQSPVEAASAEPADSSFVPQTPTPLAMDAYSFTGRGFLPGDLLSTVYEGENTILFGANPDDGFHLARIARLPGRVIAMNPHSDRGGLDVIIGSGEDGQSTGGALLYRVRFEEAQPRMIYNSFERGANEFAWSFDGRFMAYVRPRNGPGENGSREVRLVDLERCDKENCITSVIGSSPDLDFYALRWSPVGYRLAANSSVSPSGLGDVFMAEIMPDAETAFNDLTLSPNIDDRPVAWRPDGGGVYYPCSGPETGLNQYDLCSKNLSFGQDAVIGQLGYAMQYLMISPDGKLAADQVFAFENGVLQIRALDLSDGSLRQLISWPAQKGGYLPAVFSPDGTFIAVSSPDLSELRVVRLSDDAQVQVMQSEPGGVVSYLWVP